MTTTDRKMFSADIPDLLAKVTFDAIDIQLESLYDAYEEVCGPGIAGIQERKDLIRDNIKKLACLVPKGPDVIKVIVQVPGLSDQEVTICR